MPLLLRKEKMASKRTAITQRLVIAVAFLGVALSLILPSQAFISASISPTSAPPPSQRSDKGKTILLHNADVLTYDNALMPNVQRLIGNVELQHDSWYMKCDSAYLNDLTNSFEAFGMINITEGDSIVISARYLKYDGQTRLAILQENVRLSNKNTTVNTELLFYDRNIGLAYYENGGVIEDSINFLSSEYAEHEVSTGNTYFEHNVELTNPDFVLTTERLQYNTKNKICNIITATTITSDSTIIETNRGTYDTDKELGILLDRSVIYDPNGLFTGDSICYDKQAQIGQVFGDMFLDNQKEKIIFRGDYGYLDRNENYTFATQRAYATDYSKSDSLYIAADTLEGINHSLPRATKQETVKLLRAYHNVRLFRKDLQAVSDSINYFSLDSMMSLYGNPILWKDSTQLKADTMFVFFSGDTLQHCYGWNNASSIRQIDEKFLDQVKSDSISTFFADSTIRRVLYSGNTESIYHLKQEGRNRYYAISRIKSPSMDVYLDADTIEHILWNGKVEGNIYPIETVSSKQQSLPGTVWSPELRPNSPKDIFVSTTDSTGIKGYPEKMSLTQLSQFNGLLAWHIFGKEFTRLMTQDSIQRNISPSTNISSPTKERGYIKTLSFPFSTLSPYIQRPTDSLSEAQSESESLIPLYIQQLIYIKFVWHSFTDQDFQRDLIPSPFTGILKRRP